MQDFKLHLWDIFVYAGIGVLVASLYVLHEALVAPERLANVLVTVKDVPASAQLVFVASLLMLVGALIEPLANIFEKGIFKVLKRPESGQTAIETYIAAHFTNKILGEGQSPYHLCKDYVVTKGLSSTFMPFLAKFGFYRSASFCLFAFAFWLLIEPLATSSSLTAWRLLTIALSLVASSIYMWRARQFLSYQAPSIFNGFLVPHLGAQLEATARPKPAYEA